MKKETLIERIEKATATIAKKENTIVKKTAQIEKKSATLTKKYGIDPKTFDKYNREGFSEEASHEIYWTMCDIDTLEDDIRRGTKEIAEIKERLTRYEEELKVVVEKENSRNVKAILDFLAAWKEKCINYHIEMLPSYLEARSAWYDLDREFSRQEDEAWNDRNEYHRIRDAHRNAEKEFRAAWGWIGMYVVRDRLDMERLEKDYQRECEFKYDDIIERTNELIGEIKDASKLKVNHKAGLDGIIVGERGTVKVSTIGAGGYNIQRFHFRTLIHKIG